MGDLKPISHKEFNEFIKGKGFKGRNDYKLTLFIPGFFGWCSTRGRECFPPTPCNSFVFKVRRLRFCTELLWSKINILWQENGDQIENDVTMMSSLP